MTLLHDYFHLRNQQAFQRLLDGSADRGHSNGLSSSGGKSWTKPSPLASNAVCDVNARDWLGRTALQLACASPDTVEYVRLLLRHPTINVNLADTESHWTPLHRALYNANFPAAMLLLQRSDTDRTLQDLEGYTAFDLYNSTLNGTKPHRDAPYGELFTWGANRNAALGFADGGERAHPDQVIIQKKDVDEESSHLVSRFFPIYVRQVQMSKLHTAVITSESGGNLRLCGFGSGGRLGPGQHTQYSLKPLQQLTHSIVSVALGQDHTLALTKTGEVLSWGLNRFSQLGYIIEGQSESFGKTDESIQAIPRKVVGPLKKEIVKGVAASKGASVCWTDLDVFTWGTNNGQLGTRLQILFLSFFTLCVGYDKAAQAVQILPRKATKVTQPVIDISISDSAMACLLDTHDVICIWNDRHVKIVFPGHAFPSDMQPYRPPQAVRDARIVKITSCDDMFAALSFSGELFTFSVANPSEAGAASAKEKSGFKPQRVWALRKKFSSVKDVALGSDGSIIVCTESGHVFVRSRNLKSGQTLSSGKAFKFQRLSALQRVTKVCANSTGAFGALRVEYHLKPIEILGHTFAQDLTEIQPYLRARTVPGRSRRGSDALFQAPLNDDSSSRVSYTQHDDDADDSNVKSDLRKLRHILDILELQHKSNGWAYHESHPAHGADVLIYTSCGFMVPAHRVILGARSRVLLAFLNGSAPPSQGSRISLERLKNKTYSGHNKEFHFQLSGCQPISLFILLTFLYTDEVLAPWDHRVSRSLGQPSKELKIDLAKVKAELRDLATLLDLPTLAATLGSPIKSAPSPSLETAMQRLFDSSQTTLDGPPSVLKSDVILLLADREVYCHSIILRSRSVFFANFFDEKEWTSKRRDAHGVLRVDMAHLHWRVMQFVLKFLCFGAGENMFDSLEFVSTVDEVLEFMFDVMAAANELLLDRLVSICSSVILQHVNVHNACFVLAEATYLHAEQLIDRIQSFITVNMELFLETGILDDIPSYLIKQLAQFARQKQVEKSPISRSDLLVEMALEKHKDWLELQDFPVPLGRQSQGISRKESATLKMSRTGPNSSPQQSPSTHPQLRRPASNDDIFAMDEALPSRIVDQSRPPLSAANPLSSAEAASSTSNPTPVWKAASNPRVDMKTVMAEAASASANTTPTTPRRMHDSDKVRGSPSHHPPGVPDSLRSQRSMDLRSQAGPSRPIPAGWRAPTEPVGGVARPSPPTTPSKEVGSSPRFTPSKEAGSVPRFPPLTPRRPSGPTAGPSTATVPGLGPVITPTRQPVASSSGAASSSSSIRRTSGGKAWTQPPPSVVPPSKAPATVGMSLIAIQQLELDRLAGEVAGKDRRSLREIQEEEQALQAEADFLAWWAEEEERVRLEAVVAEAEVGMGAGGGKHGPGPGGRRRGGKRKADQGREKGGAGAGTRMGPGTGTGVQSRAEDQTGAAGGGRRKPRKPSQKGGPGAARV
ncbi:hypothetical protein H0H87_004733 [Tephrocybe sp. NHM501043]|nr:hypothetical protein H0H87_004733 [Tephrocybe sp. NHM501043]